MPKWKRGGFDVGLCRRFLLPDFETTLDSIAKNRKCLDVVEFGYQEINRDDGFGGSVVYPPLRFRDIYETKFKTLRTLDLLGGPGVECVDLSVPSEERSVADIITDYGTTEHVGVTDMEQYNCWLNAHNLLRVNGVAIHALPETGKWPGHCKWYYSFDFFENFENCGYEIIDIKRTWHGLVYCKLRKTKKENLISIDALMGKICHA